MRFYQYKRSLQIGLTLFWSLILVFWMDICLGHVPHRRYGALALWVVTALINLSSIWFNYWTVKDDALVQHALFYRKTFSVRGLRYAGPVRGTRLGWLVRKSIQIQMSGFGDTGMHFVKVADRAGFLAALRRIAPDAEIVELPSR